MLLLGLIAGPLSQVDIRAILPPGQCPHNGSIQALLTAPASAGDVHLDDGCHGRGADGEKRSLMGW